MSDPAIVLYSVLSGFTDDAVGVSVNETEHPADVAHDAASDFASVVTSAYTSNIPVSGMVMNPDGVPLAVEAIETGCLP